MMPTQEELVAKLTVLNVDGEKYRIGDVDVERIAKQNWVLTYPDGKVQTLGIKASARKLQLHLAKSSV